MWRRKQIQARKDLRVFNKKNSAKCQTYVWPQLDLNYTPLPYVFRNALKYTTPHYIIIYYILYIIIYYTNSTVQIPFWDNYSCLATKEVIFISHNTKLRCQTCENYMRLITFSNNRKSWIQEPTVYEVGIRKAHQCFVSATNLTGLIHRHVASKNR